MKQKSLEDYIQRINKNNLHDSYDESTKLGNALTSFFDIKKFGSVEEAANQFLEDFRDEISGAIEKIDDLKESDKPFSEEHIKNSKGIKFAKTFFSIINKKMKEDFWKEMST